jgi:SAM-dependent methyltransferase
MPAPDKVNEAVRTGIQKFNSLNVNVRSRRSIKKIAIYRKIFETMFKQIWSSGKPITWIDIGSGYGETLQAVKLLAPQNSIIKGVEPMKHKAEAAAGLGLDVINDYLQPGQFQADVVSLIDIYSHVPDFWTLLDSIKSNLKPQGEFFLESGNLADLDVRQEFFGELGLPDHLVFAGESHFVKYLESSGFEVLEIRRERADDLVDFVKSVVKKIIGRPVNISVPYTSRYRQLKIRAKLKAV